MTFEKGKSGNPSGRPRGSRDKRTIFREMIEPHSSTLVNKAIDMALTGNEQMLRLILERILPAKPKSNPINIVTNRGSLADKGQSIVNLLLQGEISTGEANSLLQAITNQAKIIEHTELMNRIEILEKKSESIKQH